MRLTSTIRRDVSTLLSGHSQLSKNRVRTFQQLARCVSRALISRCATVTAEAFRLKESAMTISAEQLRQEWATAPRWRGVERTYSADDVVRLRGAIQEEHTLARRGAERLWSLLHDEDYVHALGALTGNQAVQMVRAGLKAIYLSGWQVAADANLAGQTYPDQSLYPANSVPAVVRRINNALLRAAQITHRRRQLRHRLAGADRRRRRGRLRWRAQRVRADDRDDRRRCGRRALGGPARVREEVRPPGRQGADPDRAAHPHAGGGPPGGRRGRACRA